MFCHCSIHAEFRGASPYAITIRPISSEFSADFVLYFLFAPFTYISITDIEMYITIVSYDHTQFKSKMCKNCYIPLSYGKGVIKISKPMSKYTHLDTNKNHSFLVAL